MLCTRDLSIGVLSQKDQLVSSVLMKLVGSKSGKIFCYSMKSFSMTFYIPNIKMGSKNSNKV